MSAEENKALIRRYFEAIDRAKAPEDAQMLDEFMAEDFVEHTPFPGLPPTRDGWKEAFRAFLVGAPGYHVIEDLIAEGDRVAARITAYGKHEGELFGVPRAGREIRVTGMSFWRIRDGKIVEHWHETDQMGLMIQLGVVEPPGPSG
jgi:predicted ester cyclase